MSEAVFRPVADGATVHWITSRPARARVTWGHDARELEHSTEFLCDGPTEVRLDGLRAGEAAFYRCAFGPPGVPGDAPAAALGQRPLHRFTTARPPGSPFRVGLIADSHIYALDKIPGARANAEASIQALLGDELDFAIFLGDEVGVHFVARQPATFEAAEERWREWRRTYTSLLETLPSYFVLGNHEGEAGYYQRAFEAGALRPLQRWGTIARKRTYLNPLPDTYPEGGEDEGWVGGPGPASGGAEQGNRSPLQNYFAWTWGDALFVVLDVHRYTLPGANARPKVADWTLGAAQLAWLERTLAHSRARHKLVFAHHVVGGWAYDLEGRDAEADYEYGRGGARYALIGEQGRITELMNASGARFFFYGHDHVFAHQSARDVEFVCCGRPTFLQPGWWDTPGWREAYGRRSDRRADSFLAAIGFTRLSVSAERVTIEYVRSGAGGAESEVLPVTAPGDGVVYRWSSDQPSPSVVPLDPAPLHPEPLDPAALDPGPR